MIPEIINIDPHNIVNSPLPNWSLQDLSQLIAWKLLGSKYPLHFYDSFLTILYHHQHHHHRVENKEINLDSWPRNHLTRVRMKR